MAHIIETPNPFRPMTDVHKSVHEGGITIMDWLKSRFPGFKEFNVPTICLVNGKALLRKDWIYTIQEEDVVNFITIPTGPTAFIVIAIVMAVASIAVSLAMGTPEPNTPGEQPASDPVYSTKGQSNTVRLGEPIECCYGRNRIYPSYASRPYFQYINNDQFQYSLFCLGHGYFEIEAVQIGDSDISLYQEVEYEIIQPGGTVTLFPTNVYTSVEAGGQELFGSNEDNYPHDDDGWVGPFSACPSGSQCSTIQLDVVFPKGVYWSSSTGNLSSLTINYQAQAREIDDAGDPIGLWFDLGGAFSAEGKTTTPQRKTISYAVTPARYEVRMRRTNQTVMSHRAGHQIKWEGLRSYVLNEQDFGDVTLLAVKIRATNNLNDRTQQKFNVIATRKLQTHQSDGFTTVYQTTRSIIWALVDIFRATYGGRVTDENFFDWDTLYELEALYEERGEHFDWVFRDPITVWEAARVVARAGRAIPLISGSLISMKRDGPLTVPVAVFTPDNIIDGTLTWDVKLWDLEEYDSIRLEYTEALTGYKQETVVATLPYGTTDNPQDIRLPGVQDRNHAYHEAMYMLGVNRYQRENISFETGMEGYIPTFGDLIIITHDVPRWSQSGYVVHAEDESSGYYRLWLSVPLDWDEIESGQNPVIILRNNLGTSLGPYDVLQTEDSKQVLIYSDESTIDFLEGGTNDPMLFIFGASGQISKYARVVKIDPQGNERVRITAVNDNSIIHSFDELEAPALEDADHVPQIPELPAVTGLQVTQLNATVLQVEASWNAAFGSQYYIVQESNDGVDWTNVAETVRTSIQWQVRPGSLYVRVAGVNYGQGAWATTSIAIGELAGLDVIQDFDVLEWIIEWLQVLNALSYDVKVYDNSSPSNPVLKRTTNILMTADRTFTYDLADAVADGNENREMLVSVTPKFSDGDGTPTEQEFSNPVPEAPTNPVATLDGLDSNGDFVYHFTWTVPAEDDLIGLKLWVSETEGFDPDVVAPEVNERNSGVGHASISVEAYITIAADSYGEHPPLYWRVGVFDIWGEENLTNLTAQQSIPATSGWVA